jgi:hypothetical protein
MKYSFNYEKDNMRFGVDIYTKDVHTNHFMQKLTEEEKNFFREAIQHAMMLTLLKLKQKGYDLSKMQG